MKGRRVVVVGGTEHGSVVDMPSDVHQLWYANGAAMVAHPVRRAWYWFPGRTAPQAFEVVGVTYWWGENRDVIDAALIAWRNGWAPPDEANVRRTAGYSVPCGAMWTAEAV